MFFSKTADQPRQKRTTTWQYDLLALVLILLGVGLAFWPHLGAEDGLFFGDHRVVFRRRWWFVRQFLGEFQWPALTNASPAGVPLEAMLNGTYTPLTAILFFADFDIAYDFFVTAHVFLLASGIFILARRLKADQLTAISVASMALAGPFLSFENLLVGLQGLAYCPWVLWAWLKLLQHGDRRRVAILAAMTGFQLQAIMPEVLLLDLVGAGFIFLYCMRSPNPPRLGRVFGLGFIALILALATASIELFPVLEYLNHSRRGSGFSYREASLWSFHSKHVLEFFVPGFWFAPENPFSYFPELTGANDRSYLLSLYFGGALAIAASAWRAKLDSRWYSIMALAVLLLSLFLAAGDATPLHRWLVNLPLFESTRYPIKFTILTTAAIGLLLGLGIHALKDSARPALLLMSVQLIFMITLWSVMAMPEISTLLSRILNAKTESGAHFGIKATEYWDYSLPAMMQRIHHATAFCALSVAVLAVLIRRPQMRFILTILLWLDLGIAAWYSVPAAPIQTETPLALRAELEHPHQRYYDVAPNGILAPVTRKGDETFFEAQSRSMLSRGTVLFKNARRFEDFDSDAQSHPASSLAWDLLQNSQADQAERILGRSGVKKVSIYRKIDRPNIRRFEIPDDKPVYVFDVPKTRPYVQAYADWKSLSLNDRRALHQLFALEENWETGVAFDDSPEAFSAVTTTTARAECQQNTQTEHRKDDDPKLISIDFESPCNSLVVALENKMHGWKVYVDGEKSQLIPAEFGMLGVFVPKGQHRVMFRYEPLLERWIPLWIFGWLLIMLLLVWPDRKKI